MFPWKTPSAREGVDRTFFYIPHWR